MAEFGTVHSLRETSQRFVYGLLDIKFSPRFSLRETEFTVRERHCRIWEIDYFDMLVVLHHLFTTGNSRISQLR